MMPLFAFTSWSFVANFPDAVYVDRPTFVAALNDDEEAIARDVRLDRHVKLA
jgi:hypothetical protein